MHTCKLETEPGMGSPGRLFALLRNAVFLAAFLAALALPILAPTQEQEKRETALRMAHLSPDTPEVNVYVDDEPIDALSEVSFKTVSPYLTLPAGTRNVKVYVAGNGSEPLLEADVDLEGKDSYTLAATGLLEDDSLAARLYEDDNSPPSGEDARLRVVHAVPDIGPATVGVEGGKDLFALPGFSNASDYVEVLAGTHTLEVEPAGTHEVALRVPDVELLAGEVYTAFAVGRAADGSLGAVLVSDSAGDSTTLLNTGGRGEPRDEEKPGADVGYTEVPEAGGLEAEPVPVPALPEYLAPIDDVVTGFSELFDEVVPIEPVYRQSTAQYGAAEVLDPVTPRTTARESRPYQGPGRANEGDKVGDRTGDQSGGRPAGDTRDTRPARADITPPGGDVPPPRTSSKPSGRKD